MKTQMERMYPILVDIGTQLEKNADKEFVFFYDDGNVYRAFTCDAVSVERYVVRALSDNQAIVTIPSETTWRMIKRDRLEFVTGKEMDEADIRNLKAKKDLQKALIKELGIKEDGSDGVATEYAEKGFNPKLYN